MAQLTSFSSACVQFTCQSIQSATITSSASQTGSNSGDFANAHTGLRLTRPFTQFPTFFVQTGNSGVAVSATPGRGASAQARWGDTWRPVCPSTCSVLPDFGTFQWVLHLDGVIDPILVAPSSSNPEPSDIEMSLSYGDANSGYQLIFDVCYDSGPCAIGSSSFSATLQTPSGTTDLTPHLVFGTNASGQPTVSLDVSLGTSFCQGNAGACSTWGDIFRATASIDNSGSTTHFMDFSATFNAAVVSLDPNTNWVSDGGRTAPISPALVTSFSGQYLQPLTQSTNVSSPTINNVKNGRVIPVKVQLSQGNTAITDQNAPGPVTILVSGPIACSSAPAGDIGTYADAGQSNGGTNQYRFDTTLQAWVYNLDTRALGLSIGSCYRIDTAVNGTVIPSAFVVIRPTM